MDDVAQGVVAAVPYRSDTELQLWLERLDQECRNLAADGEGADWDQFKLTLNAWTADGIQTETVERFVEYVEANCSSPMDVLKQIGQSGADLVQVYAENLGWVTDAQRKQLDELWEIRGDWRTWLPAELDDRWPDWRSATPDVLAPWLDETLPSLVLSSGATEEAESDVPLDEAVWTEYLKQWNGDWDGNEETWHNFAERLVYFAPEGWQSTAQELVAYVESQPDKAATLTDVYGIDVGAPAVPAPDPGEWASTDEEHEAEYAQWEALVDEILADVSESESLSEEELRQRIEDGIRLRAGT